MNLRLHYADRLTCVCINYEVAVIMNNNYLKLCLFYIWVPGSYCLFVVIVSFILWLLYIMRLNMCISECDLWIAFSQQLMLIWFNLFKTLNSIYFLADFFPLHKESFSVALPSHLSMKNFKWEIHFFTNY